MNMQIKKCIDCSVKFEILSEDMVMYQSMNVPTPEKCPVCRWKHMLAFWRFGRFRKAKSDLSGESIITITPEHNVSPIYSKKEWSSDTWDPMSYGLQYNLSRSFFDQYKELQAKVPIPHQTSVSNVNSDWSDDVWYCKNAYLCRSVLECEDVRYCYRLVKSKNSMDLAGSFEMNACFECAYCFRGFKTHYAFNSRDTVESSFLYDCRNVQNCFMSWNLRNKSYCIKNRPLA